MSDSSPPSPLTDLPVVTPADPVPVYSCHVILSGPDDNGLLHGRVTSLPDLSAQARSERELLTQLVKQFKQAITSYRHAGREVPWITDRTTPADGERQRWIPVHL